MSDSLFLNPIPANRRIAWLAVQDTSDKQLDLSGVKNVLESRGINFVTNADNTHYRRVQVNVLYVGKSSLAAIDQTRMSGFGGALAGGLIGAGTGASISRSPMGGMIGAGIGGIIGAGIEMAVDAFVAAVTYCIVADIQISEYVDNPVNQTESTRAKQGSSSTLNQNSRSENNWKIYRTRVVAYATKVNLGFEEARPVLEQNLSRSIAGLFPQF
jgi:hypothetical protein